MNNECAGVNIPIKKRSGLPEKCVVKRFRGKKGRFRGNMMGKRVDFSARTVISPDSIMDVQEVGVPYSCARKLTFMERVNAVNIHELTEMVHRGHEPLNGAKSIIDEDDKKTFLEFHKNIKTIRLQLGWKVERYMRDGDTVLFNRQPSLRKKSIMAHTVRLMPGNTFRLNVCCCAPYNADFDGDEMNLHFLQNAAAVTEAKLLCSVESQLLNAQNSKPNPVGTRPNPTNTTQPPSIIKFVEKNIWFRNLVFSISFPESQNEPKTKTEDQRGEQNPLGNLDRAVGSVHLFGGSGQCHSVLR